MAWKTVVPPVCNACRVSLTSGGTCLKDIQLKEHLSLSGTSNIKATNK